MDEQLREIFAANNAAYRKGLVLIAKTRQLSELLIYFNIS